MDLEGEETYVWIGRYQPFHVGHRFILEESLNAFPNRHLLGISWADEAYTDQVRPDAKFSQLHDTFSPYERYEIIRLSIADLQRIRLIDVVPVPRNDLSGRRLAAFLPSSYVRCCTDKDEEDQAKAQRWRDRGERVAILRIDGEHTLTGTKLRQLLREGRDWKEFICVGAHDFFIAIDGPQRLMDVARKLS